LQSLCFEAQQHGQEVGFLGGVLTDGFNWTTKDAAIFITDMYFCKM
jgi:hypothetical protein